MGMRKKGIVFLSCILCLCFMMIISMMGCSWGKDTNVEDENAVGEVETEEVENSYDVAHGYVYSDETKEPLVGANVFLEKEGTFYSTQTDEEGFFSFKDESNIPSGAAQLFVQIEGYIENDKIAVMISSSGDSIDVGNIFLKKNIDPSIVLQNKVDEYVYTYGTDLTVAAHKENNRTIKEIVSLDNRRLGYRIYDLDGDGQEELLILKVIDHAPNSDGGGYGHAYEVGVEIYECENNSAQIVVDDPTNLFLPISGAPIGMDEKGFFLCQITEDGKINIEIFDMAALFADGRQVCYYTFTYNSSYAFDREQICDCAASDPSIKETIKGQLESSRYSNIDVDSVVKAQSHISDYLECYQEVVRIDSEYLASFEDIQTLNSNQISSLNYETLHVSAYKADHTQNELSQKAAETDTQVDYITALNRLLSSYYAEGSSSPHYSIGYVDEDENPEVFIIDQMSHAAQVHVYFYIDGEYTLVTSLGSNGCFRYMPYGNLMFGDMAGQGRTYASLEHFNKDTQTVECEKNMVSIDIKGTYMINDISVTEEEFNREYLECVNATPQIVGYYDSDMQSVY